MATSIQDVAREAGVSISTVLILYLGGQTVLLLYEAEQDMLGAHVGLMKRASLVLSQDEHLARFVGEFLE